jgi:hypothetical protein
LDHWTIGPNFDLVDLLLRIAPEHLLSEDKRGFTPFDLYSTRTHGEMVAIYMGTKGPYAATKEIEASSTIISSATSLIVFEQLLKTRMPITIHTNT